jgi:hypothetical protein
MIDLSLTLFICLNIGLEDLTRAFSHASQARSLRTYRARSEWNQAGIPTALSHPRTQALICLRSASRSSCAAARKEASVPDLKVVSERSSQEIQEQVAARALKDALINLTGNLIRVVHGSGKPERIMEHLWALVAVHVAYVDIHGRDPTPDVLHEMLRLKDHELPADEHPSDMVFVERAVCRSALQIVASTLLEQERQLENDTADLHRALHMRDEALAARKKRLRQQRLRPSSTKKPRLGPRG